MENKCVSELGFLAGSILSSDDIWLGWQQALHESTQTIRQRVCTYCQIVSQAQMIFRSISVESRPELSMAPTSPTFGWRVCMGDLCAGQRLGFWLSDLHCREMPVHFEMQIKSCNSCRQIGHAAARGRLGPNPVYQSHNMVPLQQDSSSLNRGATNIKIVALAEKSIGVKTGDKGAENAEANKIYKTCGDDIRSLCLVTQRREKEKQALTCLDHGKF